MVFKLFFRVLIVGSVAIAAGCQKNTNAPVSVPPAPQGEIMIGSSENVVTIFDSEFDDEGRIFRSVRPGDRSVQYSYKDHGDGSRSVIQSIDPQDPHSEIRRTQDVHGRRLAMQDEHGRTEYTHDGYGNLVRTVRSGYPELGFSYDTMDRLERILIDGQPLQEMTYDYLGRVQSMQTPAGKISYSYQSKKHQVVRTLPGGVRTVWTYRHGGRLKELLHIDGQNRQIARFTYTYGPAGRISRIQESDQYGKTLTRDYEYDDAGQLIRYRGSDGQDIGFTYDTLGNRTGKKNAEGIVLSEHDWSGQLTARAGVPAQGDPAGLTRLLPSQTGQRSFSYGANDQVVSVDNGRVAYQYDGDGRLIGRTTATDQARFLVDPQASAWHPLAVENASGKQLFIWEGAHPLVRISSDGVTFYLKDHTGSARFIVSEGRVESRDYRPFGEPDQLNGGDGFEPGFTGLFYDFEAGLYMCGARQYDPDSGRFLQPDPQHRVPLGSPRDLAIYAYCGNDPVNFTDRTGATPDPLADDYLLWHQLKMEEYARETRLQQSLIDSYSMTMRSAIMKGTVKAGAKTMKAYIGAFAKYPSMKYGISVAGKGAQFMKALRHYGTAAMIINPPTYLQEKTSTGWHGQGEIALDGGTHRFEETLTTSADHWWENGEMTRHHRNTTTTPYGKATFEETRSTPAGSFFERFIAHQFPTGGLFDPQKTRIETKTTSHMKYREITQGGVTHRIPIEEKSGNKVGKPVNTYSHPGDGHQGPGGPGGGPGESGSPGCGGKKYRRDTEEDFLALSQTKGQPVGGVSLNWSGEKLAGLGMITGMTRDESGRLVFFGPRDSALELPPLNLDDVVTVFRSIYLDGDVYVSIDPDPGNPRGPVMNTRHNELSRNTYVGLINFEADRVMKSYSLGRDNLTREDVVSGVPGYGSILDKRHHQSATDWERFWLVPGELQLKRAPDGVSCEVSATIVVETEPMKMQAGQLVSDPDRDPSPFAREFSRWFSHHYQEIAEEIDSIIPREGGRPDSTPVFKELERFATLAGLAEAMRDQGQPLPLWMLTHEVEPVPTPPTTPSLTVPSRTGNSVISVFGGATLTAKNRNSRVEQGITPKARRAAVAVADIDDATAVEFEWEGRPMMAVALPGSESRTTARIRFSETDLVVVAQGNRSLKLTREYSRGVDQDGIFHGNWTLNLPRLTELIIPVTCRGDAVEYKVQCQIWTPLGDVSLTADSWQEGRDSRLGRSTRLFVTDDGSALHFDDNGTFLARDQDGLLEVFSRNDEGRPSGISGWVGDQEIGKITLKYDDQGRLAHASTDDGQTVVYDFDSHGQLALAESEIGTLSYGYGTGGLETVSFDDQVVRAFAYDENGNLGSELLPSGNQIIRSSAPGTGNQMAELRDPRGYTIGTLEFDGTGNLTAGSLGNDIVFSSLRDERGSVSTYRLADGRQFEILSRDDGREKTLTLPEGGTYTVQYDEHHRLQEVRRGNRVMVEKEWLADGRPRASTMDGIKLVLLYEDLDGSSGYMFRDPGQGATDQWLKVDTDPQGRPVCITDCAGANIRYGYDGEGRLERIESMNPGKIEFDYGENSVRMFTSWDYSMEMNWSPADGTLREIKVNDQGDRSLWEYDQGRLTRFVDHAGRETLARYSPATPGNPQSPWHLARVELPSGLHLRYQIDGGGFLYAIGSNTHRTYHYTWNGCGYACSMGGH